MSATAGSRADRGRARRRVDLTVVLALVLPLVVLAAVLTLSPRQRAEQVHPPELAPLGRADLGCPRGVAAAAAVRVAGEAPAPAEARRPRCARCLRRRASAATRRAGTAGGNWWPPSARPRSSQGTMSSPGCAPRSAPGGRRLAAVASRPPSPELVHRARCR
ncbi:MAG: hypothetical protein R2734_05290 [Nocardioides sp.]